MLRTVSDCYASKGAAWPARAHNLGNVVCMGGRIVGDEVARDTIDALLTTEPVGVGHEKPNQDIEGPGAR